jgi:hypothetical protein
LDFRNFLKKRFSGHATNGSNLALFCVSINFKVMQQAAQNAQNNGGQQAAMPPQLMNMGFLPDEPPPNVAKNAEQLMGFWFQKIVQAMQEFEPIKPLFQQTALPPGATQADVEMLSGNVTEGLNVSELLIELLLILKLTRYSIAVAMRIWMLNSLLH